MPKAANSNGIENSEGTGNILFTVGVRGNQFILPKVPIPKCSRDSVCYILTSVVRNHWNRFQAEGMQIPIVADEVHSESNVCIVTIHISVIAANIGSIGTTTLSQTSEYIRLHTWYLIVREEIPGWHVGGAVSM